MDGRLTPGLVGWMELGFNHPVVCCSPSLPYYSHVPPLPCCLYIGMSLVPRLLLLYTSVNKFVSGGVEQVRVIQN